MEHRKPLEKDARRRGYIAQIARTFGVGASSVSCALAKQDDETPVTT
jgi:hypothetical protein